MLNFVPNQCYQFDGGLRCNIVSATPDEGDLLLVVELDGGVPEHLKLVIEPISGGRHHLIAASDLYLLHPELLH